MIWLRLNGNKLLCRLLWAIKLCKDHSRIVYRFPQFGNSYIVVRWFIVWFDYWIGLVCMTIGKSLCELNWLEWLWMKGVLDRMAEYWPNLLYSVYYRYWVVLIGMAHLWWQCLCVIIVKNMALSGLLYELWYYHFITCKVD